MAASNPENVKLDVDNGTNNATAPSQPPPYPPSATYPYPHPPHPQWLLNSYPSAPPPDYSQTSDSKAYEASMANGPYLYATSQANQPQQQMLLLPNNSPASDGQYAHQQVILIERPAAGAVPLRGDERPPSFLAHFALSCCVFWCCGWMFGGVAFIVACEFLSLYASVSLSDFFCFSLSLSLSVSLSVCLSLSVSVRS